MVFKKWVNILVLILMFISGIVSILSIYLYNITLNNIFNIITIVSSIILIITMLLISKYGR